MPRRIACIALLLLLTSAARHVEPALAQDAPRIDYLIIAADDLAPAARTWAEYRAAAGRVTKVLTVAEIAAAREKTSASLLDLRNAVKEVAGETPAAGFQVLLLGDCPAADSTGYNAKCELPWFMSKYEDAYKRSTIPGDNFLGDLVKDDDGIADIAVGRIPARSSDQALVALDKVKAYEAAPMGEWARRLTFFAGEGRFGEAVDTMLEKLFIDFAEQVIDPAYELRMTYANIKSPYAYVPRKLSDKVIEEANMGSLLLSYMGHGARDRLDDMIVEVDGKKTRYPILKGEDVASFHIKDGQLPIMIIVACATGYLDGAKPSLSEQIIFQPNAPVAVIASSRDSHPYSNTILQNGIISEITREKRATLGEAFLRAKRELVLAQDKNRKEIEGLAQWLISKKERDYLNRAHLHLYNLVGDPGLRLKQPNLDVTAKLKMGDAFAENGWKLKHGERGELAVEFSQPIRCDKGGKCIFSVEVRRSQIAGELKKFKAGDLTGSDAQARKAAEEAVAANHARANDKRAEGLKFTPMGGRLAKGDSREAVGAFGKVNDALAPGEYVVKILALDSKGNLCGFVARTLTIEQASPDEK